ncbi:TonB-dependent hemoglobin/transferrin/lactoferrin family receptor [Glaciimonas immobilis]|uniref:Hemoglobin/transferrin/lactoferrin receptor protein n=1 Tax=Glaciimonas immobilis TaxID=728004 RepID=A0A840RPZ0_9BURK|nr:TonB-dependent hemoglobin/transferrin/lactoferrin family receptor [Glaciimonas immobilis]KAF3996955.1 TonB-dependent hemoglobin/transferrin/lactoferrin family receptor [Glaciimonas immobilis]MBB5199783.1 hemoglobin/transferrin/lactoferrin receptor protein [Glaciimonas immobilis]
MFISPAPRLQALSAIKPLLALLATLSSLPATAQTIPSSETGAIAKSLLAVNTEQPLEEISVTATRSETPVSRTPSSISVINAATIEEQQVKDVKNLLRYEPGVTVRRGPYRPASAATAGGRGGNEGINIRGLEGNRILLMEDGIRLPSAFSFGPLEAGRGDYGEMNLYKRVEILRGPASSMYGSDGLTGAVNFITKDPGDFLDIFKKPTYFSIKPSYDSADNSLTTTAVAAFGGERFDAMLIASKRAGHETQNQGGRYITGPNRDAPNPQNTNKSSLLGKVIFKASPRDKLTLTVVHHEGRTASDVLSAITKTTVGLEAHDSLVRNRYSLDYDFKDSQKNGSRLLQQAHALLYFQDASNRQYSYEQRRPAADRTRDSVYSERTIGGSAQAESAFSTGGLQHKLVYGLDASMARISGLRNGTVPGFGESPFPDKAFPDTDYALFGAFVQDDIKLTPHGAFTLVPGVRFDFYRLSPKMHDLAYTGTATSSSGHAVSPRLALMLEINPALIPYIHYARGFRTPTPDQINNSFGNPMFGYSTIGNPNLRPETSNTMELGLRGHIGAGNNILRYSAAGFTGRYRNFISQEIVSGSGRPYVDPYVFQYINRGEARISGVEGRFDWQFVNGLGVKAGLAYTKGTTRSDGQSKPLDTVNPFMAVVGLRYQPHARWFTEGDISYQAAKNHHDISRSTYYAPPSATVADLRAGFNVNKHATLYAGISNLFNNKYWNWSDVRGLADSSTVKDAYTAPGRSFNVGLKLQF